MKTTMVAAKVFLALLGAACVAAADYEIEYGFQYARGSSLTVKVGDTVTWTWDGEVIPHNVHWYDDAFNARNFCDSPPCSVTFGAEDVGKWMYYCSVPGHRQAGQDEYSVVVEPAGQVYEIDYGFQYARGSSLNVKVGDTVTWSWDGDVIPHNVHWYDDAFNAKNFCDSPPCSVTFGAGDVGKWMYYCSVPGHRQAGQDEYSVVVQSAEPAEVCTEDAIRCACGTTLTRDPALGCQFPECPPFEGCIMDFKTCPNGDDVFREMELDCEFAPCPGQPDVCAKDTSRCPCGTTLTRDPALSCEFPECPPFEGCIMDFRTCANGDDVFREMELDCEFAPCPGEEPQEASCDGLKAFPCNKLENCVFAFPQGEKSGQKLCRERTECDTRPDVNSAELRKELKGYLNAKKDAINAWKVDKKNKQLRKAKIAAVKSFKQNRTRIQAELKVFKTWQKRCKKKSG